MKRMFFLTILVISSPAYSQSAADRPVKARQATVADQVDQAPPDARVTFQVAVADFVAGTRFEGISGLVDVTMTSRAVEAVETTLSVSCKNLRAGGVPLGELSGTWAKVSGKDGSKVKFELKNAVGRAQVVLDANLDIDLVSKRVALRPGPLAGAILLRVGDLSAIAESISGSMTLDVSFSGTTDTPEFTARASVKDVRRLGQELGDFQLDWEHSGSSVLRAKWMDAGRPVVDVEAQLPIDLDIVGRDARLRREEPLKISAKLLGLDAALSRHFMHVPSGLSYSISGGLTVEGPLSALKGEGEFSGSAAAGGVASPLRIWGSTSAGAHQVFVEWGEFLASRFATNFAPNLLLDDRRAIGQAPIDGGLKISSPINALAAVITTLRDGDGTISGDVSWTGTLVAPRFSGVVGTQGAALTLINLHRRLSEVAAKVEFSGEQAAWEISGKSAPGTADASGTARFVPKAGQAGGSIWSGWDAEVKGDAQMVKFPFVQRDFPLGLIDSTLHLEATASQAETQVGLTIGKTELALIDERLPRIETIPTNKDVVFAEEVIGQASKHRRGLTFVVVADEGVHVVGQGAEATVSGQISVKRRDPIVEVDGGLKVEPGGVFTLFDNSFSISSGVVTVAEGNLLRPARLGENGAREPAPMEPIVTLAAQSEVEGTHVLVRLDGSMQRPTLTLASLPAVPEYQIMTLLVTGRVDAVDDRDGDVRKAVGRLVDRYHNPSLRRQLFDRIGVDKVGLGFASSITNPILTVGKQLSRSLYVETVYRHGVASDINMMEGHIEKRLSPQWTVDTTFGEAAEGRVGLFWRKKFGAPPPPEPAADQWSKLEPPVNVDDDNDGIANLFDLCAVSPEDNDGFEDSDGCPDVDNDGDGIPDTVDAAPRERETFNGFEDEDGAPDEAAVRLYKLSGEMQPIRFERNATTLTPADAKRVLAVAEAVRLLGPGVQLTVNGYSDSKGSEATKTRVSRARANAVRAVLLRAGIPSQVIRVVAKGDADLLVADESPQAAAVNRRVELELSLPERVARESKNP